MGLVDDIKTAAGDAVMIPEGPGDDWFDGFELILLALVESEVVLPVDVTLRFAQEIADCVDVFAKGMKRGRSST